MLRVLPERSPSATALLSSLTCLGKAVRDCAKPCQPSESSSSPTTPPLAPPPVVVEQPVSPVPAQSMQELLLSPSLIAEWTQWTQELPPPPPDLPRVNVLSAFLDMSLPNSTRKHVLVPPPSPLPPIPTTIWSCPPERAFRHLKRRKMDVFEHEGASALEAFTIVVAEEYHFAKNEREAAIVNGDKNIARAWERVAVDCAQRFNQAKEQLAGLYFERPPSFRN